MTRPMAKLFRWTLLAGGALVPLHAAADETVTYTYDARGRLIQAQHQGARNPGVVVTQQYDAADNRTRLAVVGRSTRTLVVVPLNGLTVIPVD